MSIQCEKIKKELEDLKTLQKEFELEHQETTKTGNLVKAKELKIELEQRRDVLSEKLWPFEFENLSQKELKKQYESQKEMLKQVGILEKLSTGEMKIKTMYNEKYTGEMEIKIIDYEEYKYTFPSYQEVIERMKENKEVLESKIEQGFSQLLITPFGMKLDDLIEKYKQVLVKHDQERKLLATKENPSDPDEHLDLDKDKPIRVDKDYQNADIEERLSYFPKKLCKKHQGKTKEEILREQDGFNITFIEDLPYIPRKGEGKEIKGRKQLEVGKDVEEYLEILRTNPIYQNETGMTPEEQITYAIKYLEQTNQVIDWVLGKGPISSCQLGACFLEGEPAASKASKTVHLPPQTYYLILESPALLEDKGIRTAVRI